MRATAFDRALSEPDPAAKCRRVDALWAHTLTDTLRSGVAARADRSNIRPG